MTYYHYVVHGTLPRKGAGFKDNKRYGVIAESARRAIEIVEAHHSGFQTNGVNYNGEVHFLDGVAGLLGTVPMESV